MGVEALGEVGVEERVPERQVPLAGGTCVEHLACGTQVPGGRVKGEE